MRTRFAGILTLLLLAAGAFVGVARALDFDDEDPEPPVAEVGAVYHYEIGAHAGCLPYHFVVSSGAIPPGTTLGNLDNDTGLIEGIPTAAGTFSAWIALKDCDNRSAETLFTFQVAPRSYAIKTTSLPAAVLGSAYSAKLEAGDRPAKSVKWEIAGGSLPAGITLAADGTLSGTPTTAGTSTFTVKVTAVGADDDHTRIDTRQLSITVSGAVTASISRSLGEVGIPFSASLSASGGQAPYTWTASGLPAGVTVGSDGVVSGIPTRAGTFTVAAHLVDANGTAKDVSLSLVVRPRLTITARALPAAVARRAYRARVAVRGGVPALRWRVASGGLPTGLTLSARTGTISGKTARAGSFRVTISVRDSLGAVSSRRLVLRVR